MSDSAYLRYTPCIHDFGALSGTETDDDYGFVRHIEKRRCINCPTILRKGNAGPWCSCCQQKADDAQPKPINVNKPLYGKPAFTRMDKENQAVIDTMLENWNAE